MMKRHVVLTVTALLTVLLSSFHLADDVVRGYEPGGTSNYTGILILTVFLYAALALRETRTGLVIMLLGSIGGAIVPYIHMIGKGLMGPRAISAPGVFFWVWTMIALGATAIVSAILSAQELWRLQRSRSG